MIIGISPVRLSFSGGGTDMPEFYDKYGGNVITTSINRYTYSIFHPRYDSKFQTFSPDFERHIRPTKLSKIIIDNNNLNTTFIKFISSNMFQHFPELYQDILIFKNFKIY